MNAMRCAAFLLLLLAAASGCSKVHANTPASTVPLATPAPPDRVIVPVTVPEYVEPPAAAPAPPPSTPPRTPAPRVDRPAPATPASPPAAAPAPDPPVQPPILRTTTNPAEVEQQARTAMRAAENDLARVNVAQLTTNARTQYDAARGFIRQADDALKIKNVVLARELADKAAALASQLPKR